MYSINELEQLVTSYLEEKGASDEVKEHYLKFIAYIRVKLNEGNIFNNVCLVGYKADYEEKTLDLRFTGFMDDLNKLLKELIK